MITCDYECQVILYECDIQGTITDTVHKNRCVLFDTQLHT